MIDIPLDEGLQGKVALISGGGSSADGIGNGRAAALLLAEAGARVAVVDRDRTAAEATADMIRERGGQAIALRADITDESDCDRVVQEIINRWLRLDVLDNNIGIGSRGSVVEESRESWERLMKVNVTTMFQLSKYAIPAMMKSGDGGSIINISSISAIRPRGLTAYSTSKGAVIALTKAMAVDHGPDGIRVNCILPGPMYTPMVYRNGMSDQARQQRRAASVLGVEGTGWDVGHAVRFLASDRARYITGQALVVDGGTTLRGPERDTTA